MSSTQISSRSGALCVALASLLVTVAAGSTAAPLTTTLSSGLGLAALSANSAGPISPPPIELLGADGRAAVVVLFSAEPAARVYASAARGGASRTAIAQATREAAVAIRAQQNQGMAALASSGIGHNELYRLQRTANAVVLRVAPADMGALRRLPGVIRVEYAPIHEPTNSTSVPFTRAPDVWANTLGVAAGGATGTGIDIGIIDSGIDYQHPNFGGTGVLADYQANDRTVITDQINGQPSFPTARVVGGFDFVGDLYSAGSPNASPDTDPMDCGGHGSHVAGTAAGGGVTTANAPFAGPYNTTTPFTSLKIGPGVAPQARLWALRVFGCGGSTAFTAAAIEYAVDPNGDDDFGDRLDIINMSLGSNYGVPFDLTTQVSENATLTGMVVVASAGNAADTFFISGSPGVGGQVISVANSLDSGVAGPLRINAPAAIAGFAQTGAASFGVPPPPAGLTADVSIVDDGSTAVVPPTTGSGTTGDGCQTPFVTPASLAGRIAFLDRGACGFKFKARNAELAGAIGVIIGNVAASGNPTVPPGMADDVAVAAVNIPVVSVNLADADRIRANAGAPVNVTLFTGADTASASTSRGSRGGGSLVRLKPDMAAPGTSITSTQTGITCTNVAPNTGCITINASGFIPNGATLVLSGTSMAAPHVAGLMALLRQQYPTHSPEELKAMAVSSAAHDVSLLPAGGLPRYAASRVGSGRMDAALASSHQILAYNADEEGAVGVLFDLEPTSTSTTQTRNVRIVNRRAAPATVDLSLDTVLDSPGVSYSIVGPTSITIPGPGEATVAIRLTADVDAMDRNRDPTMSATQAVGSPAGLAAFGAVPRHYIAEESALLKITQGTAPAVERARVAISAAVRPHSTLVASENPGAPAGTLNLGLAGDDVCTGTSTGPGNCTAALASEQQSLVSPFELQVRGTENAAIPAYANIQHVGVNFDSASSTYLFGLSTFGEWSTLGNVAFNVCIDGNEDGTYERVLFASDMGRIAALFATNSGQDTFMSGIFIPPSSVSFGTAPRFVNSVSAAVADTALHNTNVAFFGATGTDLGLAAGDTSFRYAVASCPGFNSACVRLATPTSCSSTGVFETIAGPFSYNSAARGVTSTGGLNGSPVLVPALDGGVLPLSINQANMTANGSLGVLLLHHHNVDGQRAQVVRQDNIFGDGFEEAP